MFSQCAGSGTFSWIRILKYLSGSRQKLKNVQIIKILLLWALIVKKIQWNVPLKVIPVAVRYFLLIITCLKVLGLDRNFLKIVSGSGTNHSGLISLDFQYRYLIDLHGRRIHELLVMYKYNMKFFSTGCCDIARRVHPYQVRPHCGHGGPLFRYSAQAGPTLWRGSP